MNIKIGDIVRFLSDKLEGKVTGIIDGTTVNVFCPEYGFDLPASVRDLAVIHTDASPTPADAAAPASQKPISTTSADTVFLAIVPDRFNSLPDSRYELHIVNDTAHTCLYSVSFRENTVYSGTAAGSCSPGTTTSLGSYSLKEIDSRIQAVHIQAIFFTKGQAQIKNAIETEIKINPVQLCKSGSYRHNRWFNAVSLLRPLEKAQALPDTDTIDEKKLQESIKEKKAPPPRQYQRCPEKPMAGNTIEIDLHANELLETTAGMSSRDILEYQLEIFHRTLEEYKLKRGQKIVFIHGKGDGVLRQRILWELQTKYKRHRHQDASFKQYGYGATLVTIR